MLGVVLFGIVVAVAVYSAYRIFHHESANNFIPVNEEELENEIDESVNDKENKNTRIFNILLLGQTGAGKSTLINSIANYFTYSNFDEAIKSKSPICLITTKFKICTSAVDEITITLQGPDEEDTNERLDNTAMSCTYNPRVYEFYGKNIEYHIIDVPGIGDVGGSESDKRNKMAILQKLKEFRVLHGIFIVLNSTGPRLTPEIKNNYNEILMTFHKKAIPNIMFVFTCSSGSNYKPGPAMTPLRTYVDELKEKNINIEISNQTVFCLDNEGFRYQCGILNERFKAEHGPKEHHYKSSWDFSRDKIFEMFRVIETLQAHNVVESTNISEARIIKQALMGPFAKVCVMMENEMSDEMKEAQIKNLRETGNLIKKITTVEKFKYPQCVCFSCATKTKKSDESQIDFSFKQICHKRCILSDTLPGKYPDPKLAECVVFDKKGNCKKCGCHFMKHARLNSKIKQKILKTSNASTMGHQKAEERYFELLETLKKEQKFLWKTIKTLTNLVSQNAIVSVNALFEDKLKMEIEKLTITQGNQEVIEKLEKSLKNYQAEMELAKLTKQQRSPQENPEFDIQETINKLCNLTLHGKIFKDLYNNEISHSLANERGNNIRCNIKHRP